jgi:isochorismate synthase
VRFVRRRHDRLAPEVLRALGARSGWLIETPEVLRAGFGHVVESIELASGLGVTRNVTETLARHELDGEDGPAGTGVVALGALPFDRTASATLSIPEFCITQFASGETWVSAADDSPAWTEYLDQVDAPTQETQSPRSLVFQPTPEEYAHNVALAVEILRRKEIDKVVLARAVMGTVPEPIDAAAIAQRLKQREPICTLYSVPTPAGQRFVGASPELLVRRTGVEIQCHPLAGTITLPPNVAPHDYETWLLGSAKNLHEHSVLVDEVVLTLSGVYDEIYVDPEPSIVTLRTVAHLGTHVSARHSSLDAAPDALEVLRMLHPTAAVGGIPREEAYDLICRLEQHDRGVFAGPVGWIDERGDGEWWIGLRGVLLRDREFEAWAGAGIVSESDPMAEREETRAKLAVVLTSLLSEGV